MRREVSWEGGPKSASGVEASEDIGGGQGHHRRPGAGRRQQDPSAGRSTQALADHLRAPETGQKRLVPITHTDCPSRALLVHLRTS
jgi:hypothetical protein